MAEWFWFSLLPFAGVVIRRLLPIRVRYIPGLWWMVVVGAVLQMILGTRSILGHSVVQLFTTPEVPAFGPWHFRIDPLSGWMFLLLGLTTAAAALVAAGRAREPNIGSEPWSATIVAIQNLFTSFLLTADNAIPVFIGWEAMSICAYAYILTAHRLRTSRRAAYVTLLISEFGFLLLIAGFQLAAPPGGPYTWKALGDHLAASPTGLRDTVFLLSLFGFGAKSGVLLVQWWMPLAYEVTPPHLTAILAGGLLNLGLYGILRTAAIATPLSAWVGLVVLALGALAIFTGALFAVIEGRIRRLLAYSSVENTGLMIVSLGLFILFTTYDNPRGASVAMMALLFQMGSHALAKAGAFLAAGEISHKTGSARIDDLGGLFHSMPGIGVAFLVFCLSLAMVAPFSGFTAEWLTLQTMLQVYRSLPGIAQVIVALAAMLGAAGSALALTTFLKLFAFTMTGRRRSNLSLTGRPAGTGFGSAAGISLLAVCSTLYGWLPTLPMAMLNHVSRAVLTKTTPLETLVPNVTHLPGVNESLIRLGAGGTGFLPTPGLVIQPGDPVASIGPSYVFAWYVVFAFLAFLLYRVFHSSPYRVRTVPAWLGGREDRTAPSQYTSSAYANPYRMLWTGVTGYRLVRHLAEGHPAVPVFWHLHQQTIPWLSDKILQRIGQYTVRLLSPVRRWQHGHLWGYLMTILAGLVGLLVWATLA